MNNKLENVEILVSDVCGEKTYTRDDGKPLYRKIADVLSSGKIAVVDFAGKEIASESFLDEAIVEHYMRPLIENVRTHISLKNVFPHDKSLLQRIFEYRVTLEQKSVKKKLADKTASVVKDDANKNLKK